MKSFVIQRAAQLEMAAGVIFALSAVGAIILFFVGFIPVCPPEEILGCSGYQEDLYNLPLFAGVALAELLFVWLLASFAQAFAASLRLRVAESSLPDGEEGFVEDEDVAASDAGTLDDSALKESQAGPKTLTPAQERQWLMAGQPELNTWREGSFEEWIRKQV